MSVIKERNIENAAFRRALSEEMERVLKIQSDVFCGEQGIPAGDIGAFLAMEPVCWCAVIDGEICGTIASWREDGACHMGRFAVITALRGQGIGNRLIKYAFDDLFSGDLFGGDVEEVVMEARDTTVKIVCRMGGEISGEPFFFYGANVTPLIMRKPEYIG